MDGRKTNYGFGFFLDEINGSPTIEHAGGDYGFRTNAIYLPEEDVFVAVFTNCSCNDPKTISTKMAALAIDKPYKISNTVFVENEDLYKWVGLYRFDDGTKRSVIFEDNQLYSSRLGNRSKLLPTSKSSFALENGIMSIHFAMKGDSIEATFKNRIKNTRAIKAFRKYSEIKLEEEVLKRYVGVFKLFPNFEITITLRDNGLYARGTGQNPIEIFPWSETEFFFKSMDSQIKFEADENGNYRTLVLTQDGKRYPGKKKPGE